MPVILGRFDGLQAASFVLNAKKVIRLTRMDKIQGFINKLNLRIQAIKMDHVRYSQLYGPLLTMMNLIKEYLVLLQQNFKTYFGESIEDLTGFDPFIMDSKDLPNKADLKADRTLKLKFFEVSLETFSLSISGNYPAIYEMAVNVL